MDKFPNDQKPDKKMSDYILDDTNIEKDIIDDIKFNTKDTQEISTKDIRICTDPAGLLYKKSKGINSSSNISNIGDSSKIHNINDMTSKISDKEMPIGIINTLPKEEIEILSLNDEEEEHKKNKKHKKSNEKRSTNNQNNNNINNKHIFLLVALGALLMIWYTTFAQPLSFNARQKQIKQSNDGAWDIRFTDMYQKRKIGEAKEISVPSYSSTKASFNIVLSNPGDEITYNLTITNNGTLNAKVESIHIFPENNENDEILYYVNDIAVGDTLNAGQSTNMTVTAKFNNNATTTSKQIKNVEVIINYVQK